MVNLMQCNDKTSSDINYLFHNLLELDCMLNEKYFAISIHGCLRDK